MAKFSQFAIHNHSIVSQLTERRQLNQRRYQTVTTLATDSFLWTIEVRTVASHHLMHLSTKRALFSLLIAERRNWGEGCVNPPSVCPHLLLKFTHTVQ